MGKKVRWRIKQLRRERAATEGRDITLDEVSRETGLTKARLSVIENNKVAGVEFSTLERLADFYKVGSVADLLSLEDNRRAPRIAATG